MVSKLTGRLGSLAMHGRLISPGSFGRLGWSAYGLFGGSGSLGSLHRVIKVLCIFLALLTYLLLYVIQNAIITPTVVIHRNGGIHSGLTNQKRVQSQGMTF